ncbi:hypothetical protein [Bdellovibrio svalbardensis]|uniref:DUF1588 domain-containing protein n=1 Tax=Bdellovibrio svalbardensis TaxID=2972972 RepID=A0ABT6DEY2_9BACT|nr:hypothetical protein [Bdellovibrio svalbardensis]MDG0815400.1 hypothetical protein [Bdellovibrio svalbardensis]
MVQKFGAFALLLSFSSLVNAQNISERAFYARCYSHLTGKPVPLGSPIMAQVKAGTKKAITACNELLDKAELEPNSGGLYVDNSESRAVLNNFASFHRSWFTANTVEQIQDNNNEISNGTMDIYDSTEPALALTRAMFVRNGRYSDVMTLGTGVQALRQEQSMASKIGFDWSANYSGRRVHGNNPAFNNNQFNFMPTAGPLADVNNVFVANFMKPMVGELYGIRQTVSDGTLVPNVAMQAFSDTRGNNQAGLNYSFNPHSSLGGGVLGSPIYLMMNFGHGKGTISNGSLKVPRRWAQTNMTTFMCATLPALRESDVAQFVVGNSSAPFRNGTSCVMCHASLDPMAYTARNAVVVNTNFTTLALPSRTSSLLTTFGENQASVAGWPSEPVANFHRQTPTGKLYFRSFASGQLVNRDVLRISGLGAAIAEQDDYYQCAAKRYFEYFTGIQVSLYDRTDPKNANLNKQLSEKSVADRRYIEELGAELRQTQSVRGIIKKIMNSEYYHAANYRP